MPGSTPVAVGELGEFALIDRIDRLLREARPAARDKRTTARDEVVLGIGDDAAVLRPAPGHDLVVTCDTQIAGRHFLPAWMTARQVGSRMMTINLSDLAAMGATPRHALVSLGLHADLAVEHVLEIYRGFLDALAELDAGIVGGNIARVDETWFCDITLLGDVKEGKALHRSGARSGDVILVTGVPGSSAAGLKLLEALETSERVPAPLGDSKTRRARKGDDGGENRAHGKMHAEGKTRGGGEARGGRTQPGHVEARHALSRSRGSAGPALRGLVEHLTPETRLDRLRSFLGSEPWAEPLIRAYTQPVARLATGRALLDSGLATAAIDLSDGLPGDLLHLCAASRVRARLEFDRLPSSPSLDAASQFLDRGARSWALTPSDDYELLFTVAPDRVSEAIEAIQAVEPSKATKSIKAVERSEAIDPIEAVDPNDAIEPTEASGPTGAVGPLGTTRAAQASSDPGRLVVHPIGEIIEGEPGIEIRGLPPGAEAPRGWDHFSSRE